MFFAFKELILVGTIRFIPIWFIPTRVQGILSLGLSGLLWSPGSMSRLELYCPINSAKYSHSVSFECFLYSGQNCKVGQVWPRGYKLTLVFRLLHLTEASLLSLSLQPCTQRAATQRHYLAANSWTKIPELKEHFRCSLPVIFGCKKKTFKNSNPCWWL